MKIANVVPPYKSGNKNHFTKYRPASLRPQFSKILEKLFKNRLEKCTDKHKPLTESQYGFISSRSTSLALLDSIRYITNSIDKHITGKHSCPRDTASAHSDHDTSIISKIQLSVRESENKEKCISMETNCR